MADGGEGFAEIMCRYIEGTMVEASTYDLLGKRITARYAWNEKRRLAVIDVASCIGLSLYPRDQRNPMAASSYGVGLLIKDAMRRKCSKIIVGLGGSGTNDGGMGILKAFGARFYDEHRVQLSPSAYNLERIAFIDKRSFYFDRDVNLVVACDVKNRMLGKDGATYTFGRQKGIFPSQMKRLDQAMDRYVKRLIRHSMSISTPLTDRVLPAGSAGCCLACSRQRCGQASKYAWNMPSSRKR